MRRSTLLVAFSASFGLAALRCSSEEGTLPSTSGTSRTAGSGQTLGGSGGKGPGTGGAAGTPGGGASAGSGAVSAAGGTLGGAAGGVLGGAAGSAGMLLGSAGPSGASGMLSTGAGTSGGLAGENTGGFGFGFGGRSGGNGGMSGAGTAGASAGTSAAGSGGAIVSAFAPVREILTTSCGTKDCHVNSKGQHANLHDDDGKLLDRLLSTATTIAGAKAVCAKSPLVVPGDPDASLIVAMIVPDDSGRTDCGKRMPDDCDGAMSQRDCLTDPQIETIRSWIAAGALP